MKTIVNTSVQSGNDKRTARFGSSMLDLLQSGYEAQSDQLVKLTDVILIGLSEHNVQGVRVAQQIAEYHIDQLGYLNAAIDALSEIFSGEQAEMPESPTAIPSGAALDRLKKEADQYPQLPITRSDIRNGEIKGIEDAGVLDDEPTQAPRSTSREYEPYLLRAFLEIGNGQSFSAYQYRMFQMMREDGVAKPGDLEEGANRQPRYRTITGSLKGTMEKHKLIIGSRGNGFALTDEGITKAKALPPRQKVPAAPLISQRRGRKRGEQKVTGRRSRRRSTAV